MVLNEQNYFGRAGGVHIKRLQGVTRETGAEEKREHLVSLIQNGFLTCQLTDCILLLHRVESNGKVSLETGSILQCVNHHAKLCLHLFFHHCPICDTRRIPLSLCLFLSFCAFTTSPAIVLHYLIHPFSVCFFAAVNHSIKTSAPSKPLPILRLMSSRSCL